MASQSSASDFGEPTTSRRSGCLSLSDDVDTHAASFPFDLAGGGLDVVGVEVGHLDCGDLADLVLRHASNCLALRRRGALLDAGCLAQEVGRGRRLRMNVNDRSSKIVIWAGITW